MPSSEVLKNIFETIWELNPIGDKEAAERVFVLHATDGGMGVYIDGKPATAEYIASVYTAYINYWKQLYGKKDPKYISSKDRLLSLMEFLQDKEYRKSFQSFKTQRDVYLFRDLTDEEVNKIAGELI